MKLVRLRIRRLPGIEQPYALEEFHAGLNFIGGPNGSGKSSIARAVRAVIWPQFRDSDASEVSAWFDKGGDVWHATLLGRECTWTKNGRPHAGPLVPPAEHARCFTIGAEELRDFAGDDGELAHLIVRQLSGGYDIEALLSGAPLDLGVRHGHHERRQLHKSLKQLEQTKNQHRGLEARERNLVELRRELNVAREARLELARLETATQLELARESQRRIHGELSSLPANLDRLAGDELSRLDDFEHELSQLDAQLSSLRSDEQHARERLERLGLGPSGIPDSRIRMLRARVETLREIDRSVADMEREARRSAARSELASAVVRDSDLSVALDDLPILSAEILGDVEQLIRDADDIAQRRTALLAELDLIPHCCEEFDYDVNDNTTRLLRSWLRSPDRTRTARTLITGGVVAIAAMILVMAVAPALGWVGPLFFVPLLPSLVEWRRGRRIPGRDRVMGEFRKLGCAEPTTWTSMDVVQLLETLELEAVGAGQRDRQKRLEAKLTTVDSERGALTERRRHLHEALGVDPLGSDLATWIIGRELVTVSEARQELHVQSVELEQRRTERAAFARQLGVETAGNLSVRGDADGETWAAAIEDLADRATQHAELRRELEALNETVERTRARRERLESKQSLLFAEAQLDHGDRRELARRIDARPQFQSLESERHKIEWRIEELGRELDGRPERVGEELRAEIARCESLAQRYEELVATVNEIEREVQVARSGHTLEDTLAEVDNARNRLSRQRDSALLSSAGHFLIENVLDEHREQSQPRLLERAIDLFGAFTRDRFRLAVGSASDGRGGATFHAIDVATHDVLAPSSLSSGTRTQLLLSVRLAFALESERGTALPFFLDEVLSHSDPERSRAVADSLRHLVENESRQVFYLSCQPEEESLFRESFGPSGALTVFDLGRIRGLVDWDPKPRAPEAARDTLPDPTLTASEYGREIGVTRFDLSRGVESQHIFHLLAPNVALLHRMLELGIESVGQLSAFLRSARSHAFLDENEQQTLNAACLIAREFADSWAVGRGRSLDRAVLVDAGVRGRYLSSLSEVADTVDGDAERFLAILDARTDPRTKGFRQQTDLTEYLEENGYLDRRKIREPGEIQVETLSRVAPLVQAGRMESEELSDRIRHLLSLTAANPAKRKRPSERSRKSR